MRTTVTLDRDVERLIREAMRERGISFNQALNEGARAGLSGKEPKGARKFVQKTFHMGGTEAFRWDKALAVSDAIGDIRRLTLPK